VTQDNHLAMMAGLVARRIPTIDKDNRITLNLHCHLDFDRPGAFRDFSGLEPRITSPGGAMA